MCRFVHIEFIVVVGEGRLDIEAVVLIIDAKAEKLFMTKFDQVFIQHLFEEEVALLLEGLYAAGLLAELRVAHVFVQYLIQLVERGDLFLGHEIHLDRASVVCLLAFEGEGHYFGHYVSALVSQASQQRHEFLLFLEALPLVAL